MTNALAYNQLYNKPRRTARNTTRTGTQDHRIITGFSTGKNCYTIWHCILGR